MIRFKKAIAAVAAAATLGLGVAATSTPAAAWGGGGWGGGFHHYWGPGIGVGIGLGVLGAAAAASSYGSCYREVVRDDYGNYLYSRRICTEREFDGGNPAPSPPANEAPPFQAGLFA